VNPGQNNENVVELSQQQPCADGSSPSDLAISFFNNEYSFAATCADPSTRSIVVYSPRFGQYTMFSGIASDPAMRVQGYVYTGTTGLLWTGEGGDAILAALDLSSAGQAQTQFELKLHDDGTAMIGISGRPMDDGAQVLAVAINGAALVPARAVWKAVDAANYAELEPATIDDFTEVGVFNSVADVPEIGPPSVGNWGTLLAGHVEKTELRAYWIGGMGQRLVFGQPIYTAPNGYELYGYPLLTRVGIASTIAVWTEIFDDPMNSNQRINHVMAQRFVCSGGA